MEEENQSPLYGDVLDAVVAHVPTVDLLSVRHVSRTWRHAVLSSSARAVSKPWLLLCLPRTCAAYDPHSRTWVPLPPPLPRSARDTPTLSSSYPHLHYILSGSSLSIVQPPSATWHSPLPSPHFWRVDPIVALVGCHVIVAGGTCDFEDAPSGHVEALDLTSSEWAPQDPIPDPLETSSTCLSVATSASVFHVLSKFSGLLSSFEASTGEWSPPRDIRPDNAIGLSAIAFTGSRLLYAGLTRGAHPRLTVWEVVADTCTHVIGKMPEEMVIRLAGEGMGSITTLGFAAVGAFAYFYNPSNFSEGFFYDFEERRWESIGRPQEVDEDPTARIVFGCSTVSLDQLVKLFRSYKQ